ncbi:MAG: hypothetical protein ACYC3X_14155 [Pirellulaceae bacterium]
MLDLRVDDALPGDEITVNADRPLSVHVKAWGLLGASAPRLLRLVHLGNVLQEVTSTNLPDNTLTLERSVPAGFGGWIAAHTIGQDGSEAHTTPVYVTRAGFRHWNPTWAEELIRKQLAVLDEIAGIVADAKRTHEAGTQPLDYAHRGPAEQSAAMTQRIDRARRFYQDLSDQLLVETRRRN